jgi:multidrug transporter EmrE-like cation transporter
MGVLNEKRCKSFFRNKTKVRYFMLGVIAYSVVCYLLVRSYNYKGMGLINCIWSGLSILLILTIGIIIFNEPINKIDVLGVVFIIIGIWCILWHGPHDEQFIFS